MSRIAEQNIIGALLLDPGCMDMVYSSLTAEMFGSEILGRVYLEFQRGYDNGYDVDIAVLGQKMQDMGLPDGMLMDELKNCLENTATSVTARTYAGVIINDYKARQLGRILGSVKILPDRINSQIGELLAELEALQGGVEIKPKTLAEITKENRGKYFQEDTAPRTMTGFARIDSLLGGLEGGDVTVVGARPGVGKSAFVTQIASYLAGQGKRVGFYNLEMREKQIYERFIVSESGIGLARLRKAVKFTGDEEERFKQANEVLEKQDNIVITTGSMSADEVRASSRHMGYDVIIIDYLQLLRPGREYRGNRYAEAGAASRAVKALAMELDIPVIALSQLNRASEMRNTKEPAMAELRETGDIEQDASVIILLWDLQQGERTKKGCKIVKNRQGRTGKVVLKFNGGLMRFEETGENIKEAQEWADADDDCPFS